MKKFGFISLLLSFVLCLFVGVSFTSFAETANEYRLKLYDETSIEVSFDGEWSSVEKSNWIEGKYYLLEGAEGEVNLTFSSSKIYLIGGVSANGVTLTVTVDGTETTLNPTNKESGVLYENTSLDDSEHQISVKVKNGDNANFRFDGFYTQAPSIGYGETFVNCFDQSISYTMMAPGSNYYFIDDKSNGKLIYTFDSTNVHSIDIYADKNADSAQIEISVDGTRIDKINLKGPGISNTCVYTVGTEHLSPTTPNKKMTLEIKVSYVNGSSYFVFYGVNVKKYFNENDWDKNNYVLDETPIPSNLVKVEKNGNSANVTTNMSNVNGVLSNVTVNDTLTYYFKGSAFEVVADKTSSGGKFEISVDGKQSDKVNLYSSVSEQNVVVYRISNLEKYRGEEYVHSVSIKVLDEKSYWSEGKIVVIRGFNVYKEEGTDEDNVDYDQFDMKVDANYQIPSDMEYKEVPSKNFSSTGFGVNGTTYFTNTVGANLSINFRGTGIEVYGEVGPDKGKADVYIDGELVGRMNGFSFFPEKDVLLFRITDLSQSNHSCMIEVISQRSAQSYSGALGGYVSIFGAKAISQQGDVDKSFKIDSESYFVHSEGFGTDNHSGYYGGTALFSNDMSDTTFVSVSFRGSSIKIYGTKNTDAGVATVILDGQKYTYNGRSTKYIVSTMLMEITGLDANTNHELKIVIESENNPVGAKAYVTVDYFDIEDYSEVVFEGYKEIDDEHKDCGKNPELPWREASTADLRQPNTPSVEKKGCKANFEGEMLCGVIALIGGIIICKTKKQEEKQ